jgi:hypothetical protein
MIGIIGLSTDMFLAWLARVLFPWKVRSSSGSRALRRSWFPLLGSKKPKPVLWPSFNPKPELPSNPERQLNVAH